MGNFVHNIIRAIKVGQNDSLEHEKPQPVKHVKETEKESATQEEGVVLFAPFRKLGHVVIVYYLREAVKSQVGPHNLCDQERNDRLVWELRGVHAFANVDRDVSYVVNDHNKSSNGHHITENIVVEEENGDYVMEEHLHKFFSSLD